VSLQPAICALDEVASVFPTGGGNERRSRVSPLAAAHHPCADQFKAPAIVVGQPVPQESKSVLDLRPGLSDFEPNSCNVSCVKCDPVHALLRAWEESDSTHANSFKRPWAREVGDGHRLDGERAMSETPLRARVKEGSALPKPMISNVGAAVVAG
jgi:hypothetical protein